ENTDLVRSNQQISPTAPSEPLKLIDRPSMGNIETGSLPSGRVDLTGDEDPTDEDGDIRMGDSTGVSVSLGGEISLGGKKSQESNISGSYNTGYGGTKVKELVKLLELNQMNYLKIQKKYFPMKLGNSPGKPGYSPKS
ncbi:hypothetical protein Tco_1251982, partial [Tanacetum coccineum]